MSTPFDTSPVLIPDSPDEDPISNGGQWTYISGSALRRAGGGYTTTQPGGASGTMLWNPVTFADGSISLVYNNNPAIGESITIHLRTTADGANAYRGIWNSGTSPDTWKIEKYVAATPSTLVSTTSGPGTAFEAGDRIGFAVLGDTLSLWYQERASVAVPQPLNEGWEQVLSTTDTTFTDAGYFALGLGGIENEWFGARGGALFPVGGNPGGGPGTYGPGSPTFNVMIRTGSTKGSKT